jgi:hypothetical protein
MRRIALFIAAAVLVCVPAARAQNHAEVGIFGDYTSNSATHSNFGGLGARLSVNTWKYIQLEAEMNYDFNQFFTESFRNPNTEVITTSRSGVRVLHGLFGPKFQTSGGPVRFFVTVKGGFENFMLNSAPVSFSTFADSVSNLRTNNVAATFYPGGGIETFLGPIGLRAEVGDEMYFADGTHHNWRVTFGPSIRF